MIEPMAPVPAVTDTAPVPMREHVTLAPAVTYGSRAPVIEPMAPFLLTLKAVADTDMNGPAMRPNQRCLCSVNCRVNRTPACCVGTTDHLVIFRVLHYNPLSANQLRLEEILRATRNFSIVGLVATQRRAPVGLEIGSSRQFGCTIVEAGWARAPLSNKSSGVLLALRKPFTTEHIHQTWTPPPSLQGRALAARLKGGFFDLFVCCMYLPPRPQTASKRGGYQRTVEALLEWLDERLSEQKHRTTPIVLMDASDGIGLELRAGRYCSVETQCIAAAGARREHAAAKRLRETMEKHHMRATSAEMGGPTWFGSERTVFTHRLRLGSCCASSPMLWSAPSGGGGAAAH